MMWKRHWQSTIVNPLCVAQAFAIGLPVVWLAFVSFRSWHFADPPAGFTLEGYLRLFAQGPGRNALLTTLSLIIQCAAFAVLLGAPISILATKRPRVGFLVMAVLAASSFVSVPIRGEAWRNASAVFRIGSTAWAAVPAMIAAALPFAALLLYFGIRDLQRHDLELAKIQAIPRCHRYYRLWGGPVAKAIAGSWLFSLLIILFDLGTPSELYRGSRYLLSDELRSRAGVQAWSHLAADSTIIILASICMVSCAALLFKSQFRSRHSTYETEGRVSWIGLLAVVPAVLLVLLPIAGLFLGSISDHELVLSLKLGGTLRWWGEAWHNQRLTQAIFRSVVDVTIALSIGIPLGIAGAVFAWWKQIRGKASTASLYAFWFLPWLVPPTALGIATGLALRGLGVSLGLIVTALFHALFVAPIAAALCRARLNRISSHDIELSKILGISTQNILIRVVLPEIGMAILFASMIGGAIVMTEVSFAELTCGMDETLPVMLRGISRSGGTPVIDVVGSITVTFAVLMVAAGWGFARMRRAWRP